MSEAVLRAARRSAAAHHRSTAALVAALGSATVVLDLMNGNVVGQTRTRKLTVFRLMPRENADGDGSVILFTFDIYHTTHLR